MRLLIQRVKSASVHIEGTLFSKIDTGLLVLVGIEKNDTEVDIDLLINKLIHLRIFEDESHKINKSILDCKYEVLSVSQYSLYADYKKGRRPSFTRNADSIVAKKLYHLFNTKLSQHISVQTGVFQANMQINLVNDGPFTLLLDSQELR